jgi:hypothetical protein
VFQVPLKTSVIRLQQYKLLKLKKKFCPVFQNKYVNVRVDFVNGVNIFVAISYLEYFCSANAGGFGRWRERISAEVPAVLAEDFRYFLGVRMKIYC